MKSLSLRISLIALALAAAILAACQSAPRKPAPALDMQARISANLSPALRGTVGEYAALVDAAPMRVEGWGIVAGLPDTGSPDMDPRIHDLMMNRLLTIGVGEYSTGLQSVSPENILASRQISIVEVRGIIPPLARRGSTFDLYVNTLPGTGTTSLANGLLWPADLKQIGLTLDGNDTSTIASGQGPIFIPGPLEAEAALASTGKLPDTRKALISGRVIAGGVCQEDRDARLQLYAPNWMITRMIERAINAHFPGHDPAATAENDNTITLHIPAEFRDNPMDFVEQARHLYMTTDQPGFVENKAAELIEALKDPHTPHRDLGMALQGLGRSVLPDYIQPNYTSANPELRFWCARAGACLEDVQGLATLQEIVREPSNPLRRQALMAMIEASRGHDTQRVTMALYEMIRSFNTDDRILAYHALLAIRSDALLSYSVGRKMMVDVVNADCPPLIYVLEAESPRIAFIGRQSDLRIPAGATFITPDNLLTVRADDAEEGPAPLAAPQLVPAAAPIAAKEKDSVLLYWRSPLGDKTAQIRSVASLPGLVARACWIPDPLSNDYDPKAQYIGASYQRITELLAGMCADKTINATFIVEHSPDALISPTDLALANRPEGHTTTQSAPSSPSQPVAPPANPALPQPALPGVDSSAVLPAVGAQLP